MRILLDLADENEEKQLEVLEVSDIYVTQNLKILDNDSNSLDLKDIEVAVPGCIQFNSEADDNYYVIFQCLTTANCFIREAYATGKLDLTNYRDSLLVNPELDMKETLKTLARLGIEV